MDGILGKDIGFSINGTKTRYSSASHNTDLQQHLGKKRKRNRSKTYVPCSSQKALESAYDFWTLEKIVDELVYRLGSINSYVINNVTKHISISHKYYDQAEWLIYRINVWRPIPEFIINKSDLTHRLKKEIADLRSTPTTLNEVMTEVVRRILEAVDSRYYRVSSIYGNVRWRIEP
jgi:hypothetical protein